MEWNNFSLMRDCFVVNITQSSFPSLGIILAGYGLSIGSEVLCDLDNSCRILEPDIYLIPSKNIIGTFKKE